MMNGCRSPPASVTITPQASLTSEELSVVDVIVLFLEKKVTVSEASTTTMKGLEGSGFQYLG